MDSHQLPYDSQVPSSRPPPPSPTESDSSYYTAYSSVASSNAAPGRTLGHFFTQAGGHIEHLLSAIPRGMCMKTRALDPTPSNSSQKPPGTSFEDTLKSRGTSDRTSRQDPIAEGGSPLRPPVVARFAIFLDQNALSAMQTGVEDDQYQYLAKAVFWPQEGDVLNLAPHCRPVKRNLEPRMPYDLKGLPMIVFSPPSPCKKDFLRESWVESPPCSPHSSPSPPHESVPSSPCTSRAKSLALRSPSLRRMMCSMNTLKTRVLCA